MDYYGLRVRNQEGIMHRKLDKLLRPNMVWFFIFMLIVPVAAFLMDQYSLMALSLLAAGLAFCVFIYKWNHSIYVSSF